MKQHEACHIGDTDPVELFTEYRLVYAGRESCNITYSSFLASCMCAGCTQFALEEGVIERV